MRRHFLVAGILLAAALVFAFPSKADTVDFTLTGAALGGTITFSLPQTFLPTAGSGSGPFLLANVIVTPNPGNPVFGSAQFTLPNVELGIQATNHWAFGHNGVPNFNGTKDCIAPGNCPYLGIFAPNLFIVNGDGTITLNPVGGGFLDINNAPVTLGSRLIPGPVGTPEPATMALLGLGGFALAAVLRRKTA